MKDHILVISPDKAIRETIGHQTLEAAGYTVSDLSDTAGALGNVAQVNPDLIICDLALSGLSGKDFLVALKSQQVDIPVVMVAPRGSDADVLQAFRLGAVDFILWPAREPEILSVVERVLTRVHEHQEHERLTRQVRQTNAELQQRVRELTTIFALGKAVTSQTDLSLLFDRILEGAVKVTLADLGWLLIRDDAAKVYVLSAQYNLPASLGLRLSQPWDDGISSLVALSGEPLLIHGEAMRRFRIASLGRSAMIVPVRIQKHIIGLLVVVRKTPTPFIASEQNLLEAVADYAAIALVNARNLRTLEGKASSLETLAEHAQTGQRISDSILTAVRKELRQPVEVARVAFERVVKDPAAQWSTEQKQALALLQDQIIQLGRLADAVHPLRMAQASLQSATCTLNDVVKTVASQYMTIAQHARVKLVTDVPETALVVAGNTQLLVQALAGLVSNAIKYSNPDGQVTIKAWLDGDSAFISVQDRGIGIDPKRIPGVFNESATPPEVTRPHRFGGLAIGLPLVNEIITQTGGQIKLDSVPGRGTLATLSFPSVPQEPAK
jgi:signal transduction histidine kinase